MSCAVSAIKDTANDLYVSPLPFLGHRGQHDFESFGNNGTVNAMMGAVGIEPVNFLGDESLFRPMLYITENWKSAGWSAIIYMAAISGIDTEQLRSCNNRWRRTPTKMLYITLPGIKATIVVLFILAVGGIMNAGFDQIFNQSNPAVRNVSDILDTYIYRIHFQSSADFSFSTAIALFKSVINFVFLIACDRIAKMVGENGLFAERRINFEKEKKRRSSFLHRGRKKTGRRTRHVLPYPHAARSSHCHSVFKRAGH